MSELKENSYQLLRINGERLWSDLMELGQIGELPSGGVTRTSLTPVDMKAREWLLQRMNEAGLETWVDAVGNIIGVYRGTESHLPKVMMGSHIDSVIEGGKFDGPLGVLGALEVVRTLTENGIRLRHDIEVVSFTDEEGARFRSGFVGSKGMIGEVDASFLAQQDDDGFTIKEALEAAGYDPDFSTAARNGGDIKAYVELHIEQGKVLESLDIPVGIVTGIAGPSWLNISIYGEAGHAGTTPMNLRKDPMVAAAEVMVQLEQIAIEHGGVGTVGKMLLSPGASNVIPGKAQFTVDLRHIDLEQRLHMKNELADSMNKICEKRGLRSEIQEDMALPPVACSPAIINVLKQSAKEMEWTAHEMISGAGHDAMVLSKITDVGMIFVRSKDGISHNPKEWSSKEDCARGVDLLLQSAIRLAQ
jgi:allantoate deiminase